MKIWMQGLFMDEVTLFFWHCPSYLISSLIATDSVLVKISIELLRRRRKNSENDTKVARDLSISS